MKIDKDDLYIYGLISGLIICSPFLGVYYGAKWIYSHTPQKVKEKKERDLKIHELEEKLGLIGRDNKALYYDPHRCAALFVESEEPGTLYYDPHYYRNRNENRNDYLVDLKRKVDCNYNSPDIITVIVESTFGYSSFDEDSECSTLIMVHEDYYNVPQKKNWRADIYFSFNVLSSIFNILSTLSECGKYSNYYVISVPGKYQRKEVICGTGKFAKVINDFKKVNKK